MAFVCSEKFETTERTTRRAYDLLAEGFAASDPAVWRATYLVPAALMGALLLAASDLAAQRLLSVDLPVGIMTGAVGGLYLGWLLFSGWGRT